MSAQIVGRVEVSEGICVACRKRPAVRAHLCACCWGPTVYGDNRLPPFRPFYALLLERGDMADLIWMATHEGRGWRLAP